VDDNSELSEEKAEIVRLLIEQGADVKARDESQSTPLHLASSSGILGSVRLLLEHGADVAARDGCGRTPLHLASAWVSATATSLF
jgi:ankyrin repeat protein